MDLTPRFLPSQPNFSIQSLTPLQKQLRLRNLEVSFERKLSHLGSCLSAIDLILAAYEFKNRQDVFVLSSGHAGMAWYVVLEHLGLMPSQALQELPIHPERNEKYGVTVSSGSLGHGLPIAVGMALADRKRNIYCQISDGETPEGSVWESIRVIVQQNLTNLKLIINANGWAAYKEVDLHRLESMFLGFGLKVYHGDGHNLIDIKKNFEAMKTATQPSILFAHTTVDQLPFLSGLDAHYHKMSVSDYHDAVKLLS